MYSSVCVRFVSIQASATTSCGYAGSFRSVVTISGGAGPSPVRVACHAPSPGSAGWIIGATAAGRASTTATW